MKSEYRNEIDAKYINSKHVQIRWAKTLLFLRPFNANVGLDIGDRTPFSENLEEFYNCEFKNTDIDLDIGVLKGKYDIVTAFEVIEHLYNPLHMLLQISNILNKNGRLYLSTPVGKPRYLWSEDHFHEMYRSSLISLINRAGFRVLRIKKIRIQPFSFYFTGIRPLLRLIYEKHWLIELELND